MKEILNNHIFFVPIRIINFLYELNERDWKPWPSRGYDIYPTLKSRIYLPPSTSTSTRVLEILSHGVNTDNNLPVVPIRTSLMSTQTFHTRRIILLWLLLLLRYYYNGRQPRTNIITQRQISDFKSRAYPPVNRALWVYTSNAYTRVSLSGNTIIIVVVNIDLVGADCRRGSSSVAVSGRDNITRNVRRRNARAYIIHRYRAGASRSPNARENDRCGPQDNVLPLSSPPSLALLRLITLADTS